MLPLSLLAAIACAQGGAALADAAGPGQEAAADAPPPGGVTLDYDSVLDDYEPYEESDGPDWVEANDTVGRIGGWRAYARELYEDATEGDAE